MNVVNSVRTSPNVRVFNRAMAIYFGTSPDARSINWHCHKCRCDVGSCRTCDCVWGRISAYADASGSKIKMNDSFLNRVDLSTSNTWRLYERGT